MTIKMANLTNGEKVPLPLVQQTLMHLEDMANKKGVIPIYELLELCKNPNHKPFGSTGNDMKSFGLLTHWDAKTNHAVVHDSTRAVILAAVKGRDMDLRIVSNIVVNTEDV